MEYVLLAISIMSVMCFFVPAIVVRKRYFVRRVTSKKIIEISEQERINPSGRIARVYFFDYKDTSGYYYLLAGFNSTTVMYNGVPISESIEGIGKGAIEFFVNQFGTGIALQYINNYLPMLRKISKNVAEFLDEFIVICYDNGKICYYKYDENLVKVFHIVESYRI